MSSPPLRRILVIEDDAHARSELDLILRVMEGLGLRCYDAVDEALAAAADFTPDLLIFSGRRPLEEVMADLARLRGLQQLVRTPVLFTVAAFSSSELRTFLDAGAIGVLPRPFVPLRLADQVRALWRQHFLAA